MKKVLIITDVNFWERSSGHRMRIYSLVQYLAGRVQLTVVNTGPAPLNITHTLANIFKAAFFVLEQTKHLDANGYGRRLKAFLKKRKFDTVIIEYIHSSYFLNFLIDEANVILDAHDIISDRTDEFKKFHFPGALYEMTAETESEIFGVFDNVMVLCQNDYDKVNLMAGPGKALLCPHPVEIRPCTPRENVRNIAFIASSYLPNKDAAEWFIAGCWSAISAKYDVHLSLYGTVCGGIDLRGHEQITCKGFVADLGQLYHEADIIINPVRFGAGLKIKNVEALAHGLPLVTTTHGARGMEKGINKAFITADGAEHFIGALAALIESFPLREKLSKNAQQFAAAHFSAEKCFGPLMDAIGR